MPMVVVVTENAPPRLRGRLSLLLLELRAGVYAGSLTSTARDALWRLIVQHLESGSAVMSWPDPLNAAGVDFISAGQNKRQPVILDGVRLPSFVN